MGLMDHFSNSRPSKVGGISFACCGNDLGIYFTKPPKDLEILMMLISASHVDCCSGSILRKILEQIPRIKTKDWFLPSGSSPNGAFSLCIKLLEAQRENAPTEGSFRKPIQAMVQNQVNKRCCRGCGCYYSVFLTWISHEVFLLLSSTQAKQLLKHFCVFMILSRNGEELPWWSCLIYLSPHVSTTELLELNRIGQP